MKKINIYKIENNELVARDVSVANSFDERVMGLMFKSAGDQLNRLLLNPCSAIHTFFMRFPLDVVFLTKKNEVIYITRFMRPWRHSRFVFKASMVLELPAGELSSEIKVGDVLRFEDV
jgi:uncharacterized membrane protein (UPF0127 family)